VLEPLKLAPFGAVLDDSECRRLFDLPGFQENESKATPAIKKQMDQAINVRRLQLMEEMTTRNSKWFDNEMDKLDHWAEDRRSTLKVKLAELDDTLKEARKAARLAPTLPDKLERQREVRSLEAKRDEAWRDYDQASREVDRQKDALLDEISRRLEQVIEQEPLFTLQWSLQ